MKLEPCPECKSPAVSTQGIPPKCFVLCNVCGYMLYDCINEREAAYWWNYVARSKQVDGLRAQQAAERVNHEAENWRWN